MSNSTSETVQLIFIVQPFHHWLFFLRLPSCVLKITYSLLVVLFLFLRLVLVHGAPLVSPDLALDPPYALHLFGEVLMLVAEQSVATEAGHQGRDLVVCGVVLERKLEEICQELPGRLQSWVNHKYTGEKEK